MTDTDQFMAHGEWLLLARAKEKNYRGQEGMVCNEAGEIKVDLSLRPLNGVNRRQALKKMGILERPLGLLSGSWMIGGKSRFGETRQQVTTARDGDLD